MLLDIVCRVTVELVELKDASAGVGDWQSTLGHMDQLTALNCVNFAWGLWLYIWLAIGSDSMSCSASWWFIFRVCSCTFLSRTAIPDFQILQEDWVLWKDNVGKNNGKSMFAGRDLKTALNCVNFAWGLWLYLWLAIGSDSRSCCASWWFISMFAHVHCSAGQQFQALRSFKRTGFFEKTM